MRVTHPTIAGIVKEIPDSASAEWLAAGWKPDEATDKAGTTGDQTTTPTKGDKK